MESGLPSDLIAFDLETTGLFAESDRIVEIGAIRFLPDGTEVGSFQSLVNPRRPMPGAAQAIHGISDAELVDAPGIETALPAFLAWLGDPAGVVLLAHNARFDVGFLTAELARLGLPSPGHRVIDTLALARRQWPHLPNHRLDTLAASLGLDGDDSHRALADSRRVEGIWLAANDPAGPWPTYALRGGPAADVPVGWEDLSGAIARGDRVRMEYSGGTKGSQPREITPRRIEHRGGIAYLVAECHISAQVKSFRLDRVVRYEIVARAGGVQGHSKVMKVRSS